MKTLSNRTRRVGENIRALISKYLLLKEHHILELETSIITVTEVEPSSDLRHARVYISCVGKNENKVIDALNSYASLFSKLVAKELKTKFSPKLSFHIDYSFEQGLKIDNLINNKNG
tara:strand:- start:1405 stop:1755 length:351 start_codon:yes stop_codon:yes gene_type:complete